MNEDDILEGYFDAINGSTQRFLNKSGDYWKGDSIARREIILEFYRKFCNLQKEVIAKNEAGDNI